MSKIGILILILIVILGAMGLGYAHWSQTLLVTETVHTGKFCVGILDTGSYDPGPPLYDENGVKVGEVHPDPEGPEQGFLDPPDYEKNVAATYSVNGVPNAIHEDVQFYHDVTETIVNAYPGYVAAVELEFANCGSVPARVCDWNIVSGQNSDFLDISSWEIYNDAFDLIDSGSGLDDLLAALYCYQLDPCQVMTIYLEKTVLQNNPAGALLPEQATIELTESITWCQWNVVDCREGMPE